MFYKALAKGGIGPYSKVKWNLPKDGESGEWMPRVKEVVECESGYHCCRRKDLIYWLNEEIYEFEVRGHIYRYNNKCVAHQARLPRKMENWTWQTSHLFLADCAERVLPVFEKHYPNDKRPYGAIVAIQQFVLGEISESELCAATHAAADARIAFADAYDAYDYGAPTDTAYAAAAHAAYDAAYAAYAAADAATDAAVHAVYDAAYAAANAADDYDAERKWQTKTLFEYLDRPVEESLELAWEKLRL